MDTPITIVLDTQSQDGDYHWGGQEVMWLGTCIKGRLASSIMFCSLKKKYQASWHNLIKLGWWVVHDNY